METTAETTNLHEQAAEAIQSAATFLQDEQARIVKDAGLSLPQFSVLRILLRSDDALSCSEIAERMVSRDPDITRLIDKLEKQELVSRQRCSNDRRVVRSSITDKGKILTQPLDQRVGQLHQELLGALGAEHLNELSARLRRLRRSRP